MTNTRTTGHLADSHRPIAAITRIALLSVVGTISLGTLAGSVVAAQSFDTPISTARQTGVSDPLSFILSEHFPDLSMYPAFDVAMNGPDRCRLVSPLPCD